MYSLPPSLSTTSVGLTLQLRDPRLVPRLQQLVQPLLQLEGRHVAVGRALDPVPLISFAVIGILLLVVVLALAAAVCLSVVMRDSSASSSASIRSMSWWAPTVFARPTAHRGGRARVLTVGLGP